MANKTVTPRIGDLLLHRGIITDAQLAAALEEQKRTGKRLGDILVESGAIDSGELVDVLSERLGIPKISIEGFAADPQLIHTIPLRIAKKHRVVALFKISDTLTVAMADPLDVVAIDEIRYQTGLRVNRVIATPEDIDAAIAQIYSVAENVDRVLGDTSARTMTLGRRRGDDEAPIIQLVDVLLTEAIKQKASDLHIEPTDDDLRVRFRVDGLLREEAKPPQEMHAAIISRLKVLAGMDVSEKRIPQDGRFAMTHDDHTVDLRISTIPTIHGEKIVARLLGRKGLTPRLQNIGLNEGQQRRLAAELRSPEGMILICGPTSSGKTTTLYAALSEITTIEKNIVTVEDPVEYALSDVNQVQVNEKAGLTFSLCLRAFLRQNPDIIMVGEVRDAQTAQIAIRAAMTGHLLLSTIHTIDACAAPHRLIDMGVEPFLVATALRAAVAQRLVRRLCTECAAAAAPTPAILGELGFPPGSTDGEFRQAVGCSSCRNSGYKGQIGIFEVLVIDDQIRRMISESESATRIRDHARDNGFIDMRTQARNLVAAGVTTPEEILRMIPRTSGVMETIADLTIP